MSTQQKELILYTYFRSSCSARLRIALRIKGLPYKSIYVNLLKGDQFTSDYAARNPSCSVPSLEDPNNEHPGECRYITQSVAALEYLEEKYSDRPALLPPASDTYGRAMVRSLVNIIACDTQPITNLRILNRIESLDADRGDWAKGFLLEGLSAYEKLASRTAGRFSVGDQFSMADVCLVPAVWGALRFGVDLDALPIVKRVYEEASQLDAVIEAHWKNQEDTPINLRE
ncbi:hypothetical protein jhhlp_008574 [Lomentospora prolificans]|uniref:Maleylacetoacetate isomerase n=1 Tax=Lomentospora prolificans TaxID=41688 RepID=A0A2N3MYF6_9PEZI|nr:hypothetical protein jhhlp_008574 [Lomentospora prolificans]